MHLRMTNMHAEAHDACSPICESAGALAFVNESSASAARPAFYHALVVFQKWRSVEIDGTLGLVSTASQSKEWPMTFIGRGARPCRNAREACHLW